MTGSLSSTRLQTAVPGLDLMDTAHATLLAPFDLARSDLDHVFGLLGSHRIDYADLYFQYQCSEAWSLEEGIVKSGSFNIEQGVGVRAIQGEKTAFAYSDEISLPALEAPRENKQLETARQLAKDNPAAVANIMREWVNGEVAA